MRGLQPGLSGMEPKLRAFRDAAHSGQEFSFSMTQGGADACPGLLDADPSGLRAIKIRQGKRIIKRTESQPSGEHARPGCGFRRPAEKLGRRDANPNTRDACAPQQKRLVRCRLCDCKRVDFHAFARSDPRAAEPSLAVNFRLQAHARKPRFFLALPWLLNLHCRYVSPAYHLRSSAESHRQTCAVAGFLHLTDPSPHPRRRIRIADPLCGGP